MKGLVSLLVVAWALNVELSVTGLPKMNATAEARFVNTDKALKINRGIAMGCVVALVATGASLISCNGKLEKAKAQIVDTPIVCQVFEPIEVVESDSEKTKEQVDVYNKVWDYYCKS